MGGSDSSRLGERGPRGVEDGEPTAGGGEGADCARMCPLKSADDDDDDDGSSRFELESGSPKDDKDGAGIPSIEGLMMGDTTAEFVEELTGEVRVD
jgi:hypothetical protein